MMCDKCGYESDIDFAHACPKAMAHITQGELMRLSMQIKQLTEERDALKAALEKLACLGNGDSYGNSVGNCIAQEALKGLK